MKKRMRTAGWAQSFKRNLIAMTRLAAAANSHALAKGLKPALAKSGPPPGEGACTSGVVMGTGGGKRFRLYRPPGVKLGEPRATRSASRPW